MTSRIEQLEGRQIKRATVDSEILEIEFEDGSKLIAAVGSQELLRVQLLQHTTVWSNF